jgi:hypothetical protein
MIRLWTDGARLRRLAVNARAEAEKSFDPGRYAAAVADLYRELLRAIRRIPNTTIREVK